MNAEEAARATTDAVVYLPAGFMLDGATYARGAELGFDGIDFYTAGRGGALGDVHGSVVAAAFVFFNPTSVVEAWDRTAPVMARGEAAGEFAGCLRTWAQAHLADEVDYARLAALTARVLDAASPSAAPLFAAWRVLPEPAEPKALALHRLNVLRELRGAIHGAAIVASGLQPLEAVLVKTPFMAGLFGWPEPYPDVDERRAQWEQAEHSTDRVLARAYGALDESERSELVDLMVTAHKGAG
ncbi:MAG TPA: hypothetical protein VMV22_12365 [Acidimicrobiales bacterium]|nr:hypothetical protein [Acidimicrobiales bacterium]